MKKVLITAQSALDMVRGFFRAKSIDLELSDGWGAWNGRQLSDILAIEYYVHRKLVDPSTFVQSKITKGGRDEMYALERSFCLLTLGGVDRLFSSDINKLQVGITLNYIIEPDKLLLLEQYIHRAGAYYSGTRQDINVDGVDLQAVIEFGAVRVVDIGQSSEIGAYVQAEVSCQITLLPISDYYEEYLVAFSFSFDGTDYANITVPVQNFAISSQSNQNASPMANDNARVATINLSRGVQFSLSFEAIKSPFVDYIRKIMLSDDIDINDGLRMKITHNGEEYEHEVVILQGKLVIENGVTSASYQLELTKRFIEQERTADARALHIVPKIGWRR